MLCETYKGRLPVHLQGYTHINTEPTCLHNHFTQYHYASRIHRFRNFPKILPPPRRAA
jgi:hypothetical protein